MPPCYSCILALHFGVAKEKKTGREILQRIMQLEIPTLLLTISSARISFISQPPPIRNEMLWPSIWKQGEVRVPWGTSACGGCFPASALSFGRSSAPPIHQFPCCLALSLLRAFGLSPNVGWLSKAVPVLSHPPIPSSKSKLQAETK